jgi:hypothetical protein
MCEICKNFISDPYPLSGGRIARMRFKQESPGKSDKVVARGYILLPANGKTLLPSLQFERRLNLIGEELRWDWGADHSQLPKDFPFVEGDWRFKYTSYTALTWREAMAAAWERAHDELMKLENALAHRKRALEEAECPEERQIQQVRRKIQVKGGQE